MPCRPAPLAAILLAMTVTAAGAADRVCVAGAVECPIVVQMARGTDTITLRGTLVQNVDCCAYAMSVRAGQTLTWKVTGPAIRTTIRYPNGDADGPGLPASIPLPQSGVYVFGVHPNLMADGAFGRFTVTFTIR